ncbi:hypothetical protein Dimus_036997 [Dionaea muscipula]
MNHVEKARLGKLDQDRNEIMLTTLRQKTQTDSYVFLWQDRRFDEMQAQIDPMRRSLEEAQGGLTHKKAKKTQALLSAWAQLTTRWVSAGPVRLLLQKPKGR